MSNGANYEFTEEQNRTVGSLAYVMRGVGFFYALFGLVSAAFYGYFIFDVIRTLKVELRDLVGWEFLRLQAVQGLLTGLILTVLGIMLFSASGYFKNVVSTRGDDIGHLMVALSRLRGAFRLMYFLIVLLLAVVVILIYVPLISALIAR